MIPSRRIVLASLAVTVASPVLASGEAALLQGVEGAHPVGYYRRAADLMRAGQRDEAVFVFYLGQLRYRTHLAARPDLPRDRDPAVFASLSEVVGRPINEYAFGDLLSLNRTLQAVLAYDRANPDRFTSPAEFPEASQSVRGSMEQFRSYIVSQRDAIRAQRQANGLANRN